MQLALASGLHGGGGTIVPTVQVVGTVPGWSGHAGLPLTTIGGAGEPVVPQARPVTLQVALRVTIGPVRPQARHSIPIVPTQPPPQLNW